MSSSPQAPGCSSAADSVLERYGDAVVGDTMDQLECARLVVLDLERLLEDFPQLRPEALLDANVELRLLRPAALQGAVRQIAEQWLLENAALVSAAQSVPSSVSTPVRTRAVAVPAWRPPRYGRACIVAVRSTTLRVRGLRHPVRVAGGGQLDLKGVGVARNRRPLRGPYSNGLLSLPDALQEYVVERLIDAIFVHAGAAVRTLPYYGIVDTGFDGFASIGAFPAAIAVRRAHLRDLDSDLPPCNTPDHGLTVWTELLLRRYGLTSSMRDAFAIRDDGGTLRAYCCGERTRDRAALIRCLVEFLSLELPFTADRINVQLDAPHGGRARQIVDFGHYGARASFDQALVSIVSDRPMAWGGMLLPSDNEYVQPDPALVPRSRAWELACQPGARLFGEETAGIAAAFRRSELDHSAVSKRTAGLLDEWACGWPRRDVETSQAPSPPRHERRAAQLVV